MDRFVGRPASVVAVCFSDAGIRQILGQETAKEVTRRSPLWGFEDRIWSYDWDHYCDVVVLVSS